MSVGRPPTIALSFFKDALYFLAIWWLCSKNSGRCSWNGWAVSFRGSRCHLMSGPLAAQPATCRLLHVVLESDERYRHLPFPIFMNLAACSRMRRYHGLHVARQILPKHSWQLLLVSRILSRCFFFMLMMFIINQVSRCRFDGQCRIERIILSYIE